MKFMDHMQVISFALAVIGLPAVILAFTADPSLSIIITLVVLVVFAVTYAAFATMQITRDFYFRRYGIKKYSDRIIIVKRTEKVEITGNFEASVSSDKYFYFRDTPNSENMVDTIGSAVGAEIDESVYKTSTCNIVKVVNKSPETVAIFWSPKKLKLGAQFIRHKFEYHCSGVNRYGPGAFFQGYTVDIETGEANWQISSVIPIGRCYAFILPAKERASINWESIEKYGEKDKLRNCVQPILASDKQSIRWKIANPALGFIHILVGIYDQVDDPFGTRRTAFAAEKV